MSARKLPRELGVVIRCDIDREPGGRCAVTLQTAAVYVKHNRTWAQSKGWLRDKFPRALFGLPAKVKSSGDLVKRDVCPEHAAIAKAALEERKAAREARRAEREAKRLARAAVGQRDAKPDNAEVAAP